MSKPVFISMDPGSPQVYFGFTEGKLTNETIKCLKHKHEELRHVYTVR